MDELPTIKAELNRKTVEFLEQKAHESESGQITKRDLGIVAQAIWTVTAGLVDHDISFLAEQLADEAAKSPIKRIFAGKGEVLTFAWKAGGNGFVLTSVDATTQTKSSVASKTEPGELQNKLNRLFAAMSGHYTEI